MHQRRTIIIFLLLLVGVLGMVLYLSVRPSQLLSIAAPGPGGQHLGNIEAQVSSTLGDAAAMAHAKSQAMALETRTLLENPRYTGQDSLGRSWTLTATKAGQEGTAASGTYVLQQVSATWADPSRTEPFTVTARQGRYQPAANEGKGSLKLQGDVVATGLDLTVTAQEVDADLATRNLQATGGSRVKGRAGKWDLDMTAPNLNAEQNGNRLFLTGGVHAILTPTKGQ